MGHSCHDTEQLMKYSNISKKLYQADENEAFELTGCLSTCDKYEYLIQPETTLHKVEDVTINPGIDGTSHELRLKFYFLSGRHEVNEQVILQTFYILITHNDMIFIILSIKSTTSTASWLMLVAT